MEVDGLHYKYERRAEGMSWRRGRTASIYMTDVNEVLRRYRYPFKGSIASGSTWYWLHCWCVTAVITFKIHEWKQTAYMFSFNEALASNQMFSPSLVKRQCECVLNIHNDAHFIFMPEAKQDVTCCTKKRQVT